MAAYNFDHSFGFICSSLSPAVFNQLPYPFLQGVPFWQSGSGKLMVPGKDPGGIFVTMLLSVAGALVSGFPRKRVGMVREGEPVSLFPSIIGAIVLLALYGMVAARRT